ncbi:hypothetical protein [Piscinibacter sp.]|uniref:hypothetical protein n=1 Tax=Piscinibacter sp. TaxID=1903157 RepID=UPI0039E5A06E
MKRLTLHRIALIALLGVLPGCCAAASIGIVTIVDGEAGLIREARRLDAAEGLRVRDEDIVRTGPATRLVRIELSDGSALDLGADTELVLQPRAGRFGERAATLFLARGWLKVSSAPGEPLAGVAGASLDLRALVGTAVLHAAPRAMLVFVESGQARAAEAEAAFEVALAEGDAFVRRGREAATGERHPPAGWLDGLPRAFADSLPRRAARFHARPVEPGPGVPVAAADMPRWLDAVRAPRASPPAPRLRPVTATLTHSMETTR